MYLWIEKFLRDRREPVSEMSAVSWAMYYGLKAVQVPHPMYLDGIWNHAGLEKRVNSGNASHTSAGSRSIWNWGYHDDILYRMTYMFHTVFPEKLFRFWLGFEDDNGEGGPEVRFNWVEHIYK